MAKTLDQRARDHSRRSYRLHFPSELDSERIEAWLRSLSGTLAPQSSRFSGLPTIAFEVWATAAGIQHRIRVPWTHTEHVLPALRTLVPGIRVEAEDAWPEARRWSKAVEIGMTHKSRQLRIYNSSDTSTSILAALQSLGEGERVVMQWVVTPARPTHLPEYEHAKTHDLAGALLHGSQAGKDEIRDRRSKLEEPNMLAVLRVAADAPTPLRATHLISRVKASLNASRSAHVKWQKRIIGTAAVSERLARASAPMSFPGQLSVPELGAVIGWPIGNPFVTGLPTALSRQLPVPDSVPPAGRVIGRSNMHGRERIVAQGYSEATMHTHVTGSTGVGKTVLLSTMLKQDMEKGFGTILIEAKGDLFRSVLDYVPRERLGDVIVLDVNDTSSPVGFNIIKQGDPASAVDELNMLFNQLYRDSPSLWMQEVMYHGLHTLAAHPDAAFTDLASLVSPDPSEREWRDQMIASVRDPQIKQFWKRFDGQPPARQDQIAQPVLSRVWPMSRSKLANIVGQSSSSFFMEDVIRQNKILLVNLSGIERGAADLMGTLLMNVIWMATKRVGRQAPRANFLYLDEAHHYMNLPVDIESMLVEARSMQLGMVIAHQHLSQLPAGLKEAVMGNARTKIMFQSSDRDAKEMASAMGAPLDAQDLLRLGKYEAVAKVVTPTGVSAPFTLSTMPPERGNGGANVVVQTSRAVYGRDVRRVEDERMQRRTGLPDAPKTTNRPPVEGLFGE